MTKLNLGAGDTPLEGYANLDRKTGQEVYPLAYADASIDEIRASHVLEHFPQGALLKVIEDWVRVLKPGGLLKIAVPNFRWIAQQFSNRRGFNKDQALLMAYALGGQTDGNDFHASLFCDEQLRMLLAAAGCIRIGPWESDAKDCSALPVSLNLRAHKQGLAVIPNIAAIMSMPRLAFADNMFCAMEAFTKLGIHLARFTGAFWGQCLTRGLEKMLEEKRDLIFVSDYDTIYEDRDVLAMIQIMDQHPEIDALAGCQVKRGENMAMMTMLDSEGKLRESAALSEFLGETTQVASAHFGLTCLRAAKLATLPKPWLMGQPGPDDRWDKGRVDDDMFFWRRWHEAGYTLHTANWIRLGHMQLMITWPGKALTGQHQHVADYQTDGRPWPV